MNSDLGIYSSFIASNKLYVAQRGNFRATNGPSNSNQPFPLSYCAPLVLQ